jgi:hypothetical protein
VKIEIEISDDVARSLAVIASDKNIGMDTLASIVVCNYAVSRPTMREADALTVMCCCSSENVSAFCPTHGANATGRSLR